MKKTTTDIAVACEIIFPELRCFVHIPISRIFSDQLNAGVVSKSLIKPFGASLSTCMTKLSLGHDDFSPSIHLFKEGSCGCLAHIHVVGCNEGGNVCAIR